MLETDRLKIELVLKIIDDIQWDSDLVEVIRSKVWIVRDILSHISFWTPKKKRRVKE